MRSWTFAAFVAFAAGCGSAPVDPDEADPPSAPPIAAEMNKAAKSEKVDVVADPRSPNRVLGYVEGEVITYREVVQLIGPELAQLENPADKADRESRALLDLARERLLYRAATDAMVQATRDEVDAERAEFVKDLARNGGTLEAFLHEHEMSRREFDEMIRRQLIVGKFRRAAVGHSADPHVRVRPVTDTYVAPEDVQKYYDRHPERFHEPATGRCRILAIKADLEAPDRVKAVADAKARAEAVLARLRGGEDWVPVYRETTAGAADPERLDGLTDVRRGEKAEWIERFAFGSEQGTLSDVIQVGTTFYVLRAEGWHDERTIPFEEAAPRIRRELTELRSRLAWLEVELSVLDESSVQPDSLRARLRDMMRKTRLKLLADAGL